MDARRRIAAGLVLAAMALWGCAPGFRAGDLRHYMAAGDCDATRQAIEAHPEGYGGDDQLLFAMDAAMALMSCGDTESAQRWFREADRLGEALWTESISREGASFIAGDSVLKYPGEDYERVMINLMSALGFLQAGDLEGALVECRRLDSLLNVFNAKYEHKNVYSEDAFARYLSGILNEDDGDLDAAFIDYLRAAKVYRDYDENYGTPLPRILVEDLLRVGALVDREEDAMAVLPAAAAENRPPAWHTRGLGRIVYIQLAGDAPYKVQNKLVIPFKGGPVPLAFPRMVMTPPDCGGGRVDLAATGGEILTQAVLVEDINRIAVKNLADRQVRVIAKTLARAAVKQVIIGGIANSSSDDPKTQATIQAALSIVNLFTERADTRSWLTLPGEIYMARVYVAPGTYQVRVASCHGDRALAPVTVLGGETRYIIDDARVPRPAIAAAPPTASTKRK